MNLEPKLALVLLGATGGAAVPSQPGQASNRDPDRRGSALEREVDSVRTRLNAGEGSGVIAGSIDFRQAA